MDRPLIRYLFALAALAGAVALPRPAWSADKPVPALLLQKRESEPLPLPTATLAGGQSLSVEQLRAKYDADRKYIELELHVKNREFEKAVALADEMVATLRSVGLYDDEQQIHSRTIFGVIHIEWKKFDEAEADFREALAIADRKFGPKTLQAAQARHHLGKFYLEHKKDYDRSYAVLFEATEILRALGEPQTTQLLATLSWLGSCEYMRGRIPEAIACFKECCDQRRKPRAPANLSLAIDAQQLGKLYYIAKDFAAARQCFDESAEQYEKLKGADAHETTTSRDLALMAVKEASRKLPDDRLEQERTELIEKIARAQAAEKPREMLPAAVRLAEILRAGFGEKHEDTLEAMILVAIAQNDCGDSQAAAAKFLEVRALLEAWPESPRALRRSVSHHLGRIDLQVKHYAEAKVHYRRALEFHDFATSDTEKSHTLLQELALAEIAVSEFAAALEHLETYLKLPLHTDKGVANEELETTAMLAFLCSEDATLRTRSAALLAKLRDQAEAAKDDRDLLLAEILALTAMLEYRNEDSASIRTAEAACELARKLDANQKPSFAADVVLAKCCRSFGEPERARAIFAAALAKARIASDHEDAALNLVRIAAIDANLDRRDQALTGYREAIDLVAKTEGTDTRRFAKYRREFEDFEAGEIPSLKAADNPDGITFRWLMEDR